MNDETTHLIPLGRLALALVALVGGMPALVWLSFLRETDSFWTNHGGYPVWLRELVLYAYYPLLLASLGGTALYYCLLFSRPSRSKFMVCAEAGILVLMVGAIGLAILVSLLNIELSP